MKIERCRRLILQVDTIHLPPGNLFGSGPGAPPRNGCPCCCCSLSKFCSRFCCLLYKYTRYLFINLLFPLRHRCAIYLRTCSMNVAAWMEQAKDNFKWVTLRSWSGWEPMKQRLSSFIMYFGAVLNIFRAKNIENNCWSNFVEMK